MKIETEWGNIKCEPHATKGCWIAVLHYRFQYGQPTAYGKTEIWPEGETWEAISADGGVETFDTKWKAFRYAAEADYPDLAA